jgi:hypothetical protein
MRTECRIHCSVHLNAGASRCIQFDMSGPPTESNPEGVGATPPKTGHATVDLVIAGCAIGISIISLIIAVAHGRTMNKLVKANSWPFLELETSNFDEAANESVISFRIRNTGVGPARLEALSLRYDGKEVRDIRTLMLACCMPPERRGPISSPLATNRATPRVIPAKEALVLLWWQRPTGEETAIWDALDRERFRLTYQGCYCSVFDECWVSPLNGERPTPVEDCRGLRTDGFER